MKKVLISIFVFFLILGEINSSELRFWQFTDSHADWDYRINSQPFAGQCRYLDGNAGEFGDYQCDLPLWTQTEVIKQMAQVEPNPIFVLHTGDAYPHAISTEKEIETSVYNSTHELRQYFPNAPIIYALGNHDCAPQQCVEPKSEWLKKISESIKDFLTDDQIKTFQQGGYYVTEAGGYTILVLNTVLYWYENKYTNDSSKDYGDQFQFIKDQLENAKANNQSVLIVGHISPGFDEREALNNFHDNVQNDQYVKLFEGYGDMIKGHIYGHLHSDTFRLTKDNGAMMMAPALDPQDPYWSFDETANNPGSGRLFKYDSDTKNLMSYVQYYFNLSQANSEKQITILPEYDTSQSPYNMKDLSLSSFQQLYSQIQSNVNIFQSYYNFNVVEYQQAECGTVCRRRQLCTIQNVYWNDFYECLQENSKNTQQFVQ